MTSLIGMGNISIGQQLIPLSDASEATPMPRPLSVPLRQEIVRRRQQGLPLTQIAAELAIPYGTVRNIWRLFRRHRSRGTWLPTIAPVVARFPRQSRNCSDRLRSQARTPRLGRRA